jgi:hypothetical protein
VTGRQRPRGKSYALPKSLVKKTVAHSLTQSQRPHSHAHSRTPGRWCTVHAGDHQCPNPKSHLTRLMSRELDHTCRLPRACSLRHMPRSPHHPIGRKSPLTRSRPASTSAHMNHAPHPKPHTLPPRIILPRHTHTHSLANTGTRLHARVVTQTVLHTCHDAAHACTCLHIRGCTCTLPPPQLLQQASTRAA